MKKILLLHTNYQNKGGEDIAVENETLFLKEKYIVETLLFSNHVDNIFKQIFFFIINKNIESINQLNSKLETFKPDIVYVHNTWFKASLGIFKLLDEKNIKTVVKLHNFRYFCSRTFLKSIHLGNNLICQACGMNLKPRRLFNKYYETSLSKSFFLIIYGKKYYKLLKNSKFSIFVLTEFHKNFLGELGFDTKRISVFPNYLESATESTINPKSYILYAGRISIEKGIKELIESFSKVKNSDLKLKIIGTGPDFVALKNKYENQYISFLGEKSNIETIKLIKDSKAVVTATKLFEGQPTLLCEASSLGVPSIYPETGGISEFFPDNYKLSFKQYDYEDLENKILLLDKIDLLKVGQQNKMYIKNYLDKEILNNKLDKIFNE